MSNLSQLRAFVEAGKQQGATDESLVAMLRERGWSAKDVYGILADIYVQQTGVSIPAPPNRLEAARETFFHLLTFATLATWIFAVGSIWFALIDNWLPDPAAVHYDEFTVGRISTQLACVLVAFPAFLWSTWSILRDQAEDPGKAESGVRRWVGNLSLLITILVFLFDLIAFVNFYLQGELTARMVWKCLVVFVLAGVVFAYYSRGLGKSRQLPPQQWHRLFAGCAGVILILTLVFGFWSTGSPAEGRLRSQDNRRLRDLYELAQQVEFGRYESNSKGLPETLPQGRANEADPFTGQPYEYRRIDGESYELCATFVSERKHKGGRASFWVHPVGRKCFQFRFGRPLEYPMRP